MARTIIPESVNDLQKDSFMFDGEEIARRVVARIVGAVDASFTPSGLSNALLPTTMSVGDTATAIPATAQTDRNAMSFVNLSDTETLYIGNSDVEAIRTVGGKGGWEVLPGETFNVDITDDIVLYGVAESGKTILVKVLEIS